MIEKLLHIQFMVLMWTLAESIKNCAELNKNEVFLCQDVTSEEFCLHIKSVDIQTFLFEHFIQIQHTLAFTFFCFHPVPQSEPKEKCSYIMSEGYTISIFLEATNIS